MPITLSVTGHADLSAHRLTRAEARDWLAKAAVWFEGVGDAVLDARVVRDGEDKPVLLVLLHPAATPAEVRLGASGRVRVSAATSPAGPGYHVYLCDLLHQFADEFELTWDVAEAHDPTGYFGSRDRDAVDAHFLRCLAGWCKATPSAKTIGLPAGHGFSYPGDVLTPLGPRDRAWLQTVARNPAAGRDFFPWWDSDLEAAFYRNRAVTRLWCDFPWRPPLTEAEGELADQIANDLATAFKLDPGGELPWAEWLELLAAIEADEEGFTVTPRDRVLSVELWRRAGPVPSAPDSPRIGYRRFPVRVPLTGGWSVEVPGDFAREWDDDHTWTGWNRTRTVWFHALGFTKPDGSRPSAAEAVALGRRSLPEGEALPGHPCGAPGEAVYGAADEDGRTVWRLSGVTAVEGQLVVCNVYAEDPADRDWAVRTWHSLLHTA